MISVLTRFFSLSHSILSVLKCLISHLINFVTKEALYSYYMRNYPDVFAVSDKRMVMKSDGSFALFSPGEVQEMVNAGRISIEYPTTMGGRVVDLTQKPVLVLKD